MRCFVVADSYQGSRQRRKTAYVCSGPTDCSHLRAELMAAVTQASQQIPMIGIV